MAQTTPTVETERTSSPLSPPSPLQDQRQPLSPLQTQRQPPSPLQAQRQPSVTATHHYDRPYQQHLHPPQLVTDTVGFLLSHLDLPWAKATSARIQSIATVYPDTWQHIQDGIDNIVCKLEQTFSSMPARSNVEERIERDEEAEEQAPNVDDSAFALGAAPILKDWGGGWYAVQRIGATATVTNEVTDCMDPHRKRNSRMQPDEDFFKTVDGGKLDDVISITAMNIVLTTLTPAVCRILQIWDTHHPNTTLSVTISSANTIITSIGMLPTENRVCYSNIANIALRTDEVSPQFPSAIASCLGFAPAESFQIYTKPWRLLDARNILLFSKEPHQVTLSTPFIKRVANFISALPKDCCEIILPQFGARATTPDVFTQLVANKKDHNDKFGQVILGECKIDDDGINLAAIQPIFSVTSGNVIIEHRFAADPPAPVMFAPTSEAIVHPVIKFATTVIANCNCKRPTVGRPPMTRATIIMPVTAAIISNDIIYVPTKCSRPHQVFASPPSVRAAALKVS